MSFVNHHNIAVSSIEEIDWHLQNLWSDGWKTVETISHEEHVRRHTEGSSKVQWVDNFGINTVEAAARRLENLL